MTDSMNKAFVNVSEKIEDVWEDVDRIEELINVEALAMEGKERDECLDNVNILCAAMDLLENARFFIDYVRKKRS